MAYPVFDLHCDTADRIEAMGIERTFSKMSQAQIVLWVIDGTTPVTAIEPLAARILPTVAPGSHLIAVINKADLLTEAQHATLRQTLTALLPTGTPTVSISARPQIMQFARQMGSGEFEKHL